MKKLICLVAVLFACSDPVIAPVVPEVHVREGVYNSLSTGGGCRALWIGDLAEDAMITVQLGTKNTALGEGMYWRDSENWVLNTAMQTIYMCDTAIVGMYYKVTLIK